MEHPDVITTETVRPIVQGNRKFSVNYNGVEITSLVTCFDDAMDAWVQETEQLQRNRASRSPLPRIFGLTVQYPDYESHHPFLPIKSQRSQILTICGNGNRCLVIQLLFARRIPESLRRFLIDPKNRFVGYCNFFDTEKLLDHSGHEIVLPINSCRNVGDYVFGNAYRRDLLNARLEFMGNEYQKLVNEMHRATQTGITSGDLWKQQVQYCTVQAYLYYKLGIDFCMDDCV